MTSITVQFGEVLFDLITYPGAELSSSFFDKVIVIIDTCRVVSKLSLNRIEASISLHKERYKYMQKIHKK